MKPQQAKMEHSSGNGHYEFGPFRIDTSKRLLLRGDEAVPLTPKAFDMLLLLVESSGRLVSKDELMSSLWPDTFVEESSLTRNIYVLRKALGDSPDLHRYIVTMPGQGYSFVARVEEVTDSNLVVTERTRTSISISEEEVNRLSNQDASLTDAQTGPLTKSLSTFKGKRSIGALAFAVMLLAAAGGLWLYGFERGDRIEVGRSGPYPMMTIKRLLTTGNIRQAAISPDGTYIVYAVADSPQMSSLWVQHLDTLSNMQIIPPGETGYRGLTFSRDGNYVYYVMLEKSAATPSLYRVPILGGPSKKIVEDVDSAVAFSPDGARLAFRRNYPARRESGLVVASAEGGEEKVVATIRYPERFGNPSWSPDGKRIACAAGHADGGANKYMVEVSVEDGAIKPISERRWRWVGDTAWISDGSGLLMIANDQPSMPYQIWRLSYPDGKAHRLTNDSNHYARLSLTADSTALVALQTRRITNVWTMASEDMGGARQITFGAGSYGENPSWTPDGKIVYGSATMGSRDISIMDADGSGQKHLLGDMTGQGTAISATVSPDGRYVVFAFDLVGTRNIWRMDIDGGNAIQLTYGNGEDHPHCSPDGRWVVYTDISSDRPTLWRVPIEGGKPTQLTEVFSTNPAVSPDGKLIASLYWDEEPRSQLKIAVFPFEGGAPVKVFPQPIRYTPAVAWAPDGQALTYVDTRGGIANIWTQPLQGGEPERLTDFKTDRIFGFGWSRDGKQLACVRGVSEGNLVLISNFR